MNASAHALLSRAAVLAEDEPGGSLTALGALAAIPQARALMRGLQVGSDSDRRQAELIAEAIELIGVGPIRALSPDADGWECDAALGEVLQPLVSHLHACGSPCSPWPGEAGETPIAALAAALATDSHTAGGWDSITVVVGAWQRALVDGRVSDVSQRDAQSLLDLRSLQVAVDDAQGSAEPSLAGLDAFLERLLARIADPSTRGAALQMASEAASALDDARAALADAQGALALPPPEGFRREAEAASEALSSRANILRSTLTDQLAAEVDAPGGGWAGVAASSTFVRLAADDLQAWTGLDASLAFIARLHRPLATKLRARLVDAGSDQRQLVASCAPYPGEDAQDGSLAEQAFWRAAAEARESWLSALVTRSKSATELGLDVETFRTVAEWRVATSRDRPTLLAFLPRWGGWAPEPFGSLGDLSRFRGAVTVAMEALGAGRMREARESMGAAVESLPDAALAAALAPALAPHESTLPPASCDALARSLISPGTAATMSQHRPLLESIARARLAGHHARSAGDDEGAAAALARLTALASKLAGAPPR